ncbi:alpha-S1-casein isoform X2 [Elephas maximus indicus]|uniref:alpha-S1-casein isoform X2 n=1 Tax=Elephas maximus indicus TaxID=99487 RepID=UPI0021164AD5|nr:alpha-S1-casein isoform X2 [Elephas maximus indicus]
MKLLILACLVAFALARPKFPLRHPEVIQGEQDSSSSEEILKEKKFFRFALPTPKELRKEYIDELNWQREFLMEKESDELKETEKESEEQRVMAEAEDIPKEDVLSQCSLEHLRTVSKCILPELQAAPVQKVQRETLSVMNQEQPYFYPEPFQQFYQLDAYPSGVWYYPSQIMPLIALQPFPNVAEPVVPENVWKS